MTDEKMVESLWALANGVTAFAVLQALTFLYALVKKDFVDAISNSTALFIIITATVVATVAYCFAVWKCWDLASTLTPDSDSKIWSTVTAGRMACIVMFNLLVLGVALAILLAPRPSLSCNLAE